MIFFHPPYSLKKFFLLLFLYLSFVNNLSASPLYFPYYFAVPETSHAPLTDNEWVKIPIADVGTDFDPATDQIIETDKVYMRGYFFSNNTILGRKIAFHKLFKKGIIQAGDVVLSVRPSWVNTTAYAHLQLGISHAGLAYEQKSLFALSGEIRNVDVPLTSEYLDENFNSSFSSDHYRNTPVIHIVRPRNFDMTKKENYQEWIKILRKNHQKIMRGGLLTYNWNYLSPLINQYPVSEELITKIGRIILGIDQTSVDLQIFCSEFVWALLSLSTCSPEDIEFRKLGLSKASCIKTIFSPMYYMDSQNIPGLTSGPLLVLKSLGLPIESTTQLIDSLFVQNPDLSSLSSGHRAAATNPQILKLIKILEGLYPSLLSENNGLESTLTYINNTGGRNYPPSSFLISTMLDQSNPERAFDYVATIIFKENKRLINFPSQPPL